MRTVISAPSLIEETVNSDHTLWLGHNRRGEYKEGVSKDFLEEEAWLLRAEKGGSIGKNRRGWEGWNLLGRRSSMCKDLAERAKPPVKHREVPQGGFIISTWLEKKGEGMLLQDSPQVSVLLGRCGLG